MISDGSTRDTGRLTLAVGLVAAGSAACLAIFLAFGGPFGTINDVANATIGVLSAAVVWRLRRHVPGRAGDIAVGLALAGAAIAVVGSALVISGTTGFFLAGLVSSLGFAGIGAWVVAYSRTSDDAAAWPPRLRSLGVAAGALMVAGVAAAPGILLGLDDMDTAPGWVWISFLGWLGTFVVYPAWAIWVGARSGWADEGRRTVTVTSPEVR